MDTFLKSNPKREKYGLFQLSTYILPSFHSSIPDPASQGQFQPQTPQLAWNSTCRHEMSCDCTTRHCWTSTRHHLHTARALDTDSYQACALLWTSLLDSSQCQSSPTRKTKLKKVLLKKELKRWVFITLVFNNNCTSAETLQTGIPRSKGSTGCLKGRDSGSCLYRDSRVGIRAWRNSSGLNTEK